MGRRILANNQIRAVEVRLIDENDKQVGVVSLSDALRMAQEKGMDLIQVTEKTEPPVCKIGDYGKYLYRQEKMARKTQRNTGGELKEIRLTFAISPHDLETRANQAEKFLRKGARVRIALPLRGREKALEQFARDKIEKFLELLRKTMALRIEKEITREPRGLSMTIAKQ